jgi:phosphatidylserine decarboxylase
MFSRPAKMMSESSADSPGRESMPRNRHPLKTKLESVRQALQIHGGALNMCAAALAVRLSRVPIPSKRLRLRLYRTIYGRKYSALDESELEKPIWSYRSLNALFTRGVRPELRPIARAGSDFLCPCDGRIQDFGAIDHGRILTVKGIEYPLRSLLAGMDVDRYQGGNFVIIFLSPCDCHRIFSPLDGQIEEITHVPGHRLLVYPPYHKKEFPVFTLNERVILRLKAAPSPLPLSSGGRGRGEGASCVLVLVAGLGVGNITFPRLPHFRRCGRKLTRILC